MTPPPSPRRGGGGPWEGRPPGLDGRAGSLQRGPEGQAGPSLLSGPLVAPPVLPSLPSRHWLLPGAAAYENFRPTGLPSAVYSIFNVLSLSNLHKPTRPG